MFQHNSTPFYFKISCFHFKTIQKNWKTCTVLEWTCSTITQPALLDTFSPTNDLCQVSRNGCGATVIGLFFPKSHLSSHCSLIFHRLLFLWVRLWEQSTSSLAARAVTLLVGSVLVLQLSGLLSAGPPLRVFFKHKQTKKKFTNVCLQILAQGQLNWNPHLVEQG